MIAGARKSGLSKTALRCGGAAASGFAVPAIAVALIALVTYFPIGSGLEGRSLKILVNALGVILILMAIVAGALLAGIVYSVHVQRWRPVLLALLFGLGVCLGFVPGLVVGSTLRAWGLEGFIQRSMVVVDAIGRYTDATGEPPTTLSQLVPTYLPNVPTTGMPAYPNYEYKAMAGECSDKSRWHLRVDVPEFIDMDRLLYCPAQDYEPVPGFVLSRTRIGSWVHDRIDF